MEYEYSFKVTAIDEYCRFCEQNNFSLVSTTKQTRTIYRHKNHTIARLTIDEGNELIKKLDFKEDKLTDNDLFIRKESAALTFQDDDAVINILTFLGYTKDITLVRTRMVYTKETVKLEIDKYESPEKCYVVAVEGTKTKADLIYQKLFAINKKYKYQEEKK